MPRTLEPRWLTWIGFVGGVSALVATGASWGGVVRSVADHERRIEAIADAGEEARAAKAAALEAREAADAAREAADRAALESAKTSGRVDVLAELLRGGRP